MAELVVEIVEGKSAGSQFPLERQLEVGRNETLGIVLDDIRVSRRHARLTPSNGFAVVEDLGSHNGSYVNEQPIDGPRRVGPGDRVRIGLTVFEVHSAREAASGASGVISAPPITQLGHGVLEPVGEQQLPQPAPPPQAPGLRVEETPPAYVPAAGSKAVASAATGQVSEEGDQYQRVAALRDPRVKHVVQLGEPSSGRPCTVER